jgi:hypothetical protein
VVGLEFDARCCPFFTTISIPVGILFFTIIALRGVRAENVDRVQLDFYCVVGILGQEWIVSGFGRDTIYSVPWRSRVCVCVCVCVSGFHNERAFMQLIM